MNLEDKEASSTTRVCVMGLSGTGKSTLVSKLAEKYKLWWFTLDNDADILLKLPRAWWPNVELIDIPDSAVFPAACDTLLKLFKNRGRGFICNTHGIYDCKICQKSGKPGTKLDFTKLESDRDIVVFDTGSQLALSALAHATKEHDVDYKPEWDDWGAVRKWTEFFTSEWQAAKYNLVVIFHAIEATLEDNRVKLVPSFGSKDMSTKVAKAFSHVVYTDVINKKHKAFSASTYSNTVLTKSRTDFEIEKLAEPSLIPIFSGLIPATKIVDEEVMAETTTTQSAQLENAKMTLKDLLKKG